MQGKMGTVDTLSGLLALIFDKLFEMNGPKAAIPIIKLCNILHELQADSRFAKRLQYIDFDKVCENWHSKFIDNFLFIGGTWGQHQITGTTLTVIHPKERLVTLKARYGKEFDKVEEMTTAFIALLLSKKA